MDQKRFHSLRQHMIAEVVTQAVCLTPRLGKPSFNARVVEAMGKVRRHAFVPVELQPFAYINRPLRIGCGKTISQPFIVALMTDLLDLQPEDVVLEVGAGAGYQAAILAELTNQVYSVEIMEDLAVNAQRRLQHLGYRNVDVRVSNGYYGWSKHAPYDKIIVTAAADLIPPPLIAQLKVGGRMVIPIGIPERQQLVLVVKLPSGKLITREVLPVVFTPLEHDADLAGAA